MNWSAKLARPLPLTDGTVLVTLEDAAGALQRYFATVTASRPLELTITALMRAAETGTRADIQAATEAVARNLASRHVLKN